MSEKVLLWVGPVAKNNLVDPPDKPSGKPVLPTSWDIITCNINGTGKGSDQFKAWALSLGPEPLVRLAPDAKQIVIAGFSAGHGAIEVILGQSVNDKRLVGLCALDAYYVGWNNTTPKPGYLAWCQAAIARGLPAWLTTSSHHPKEYPGGSTSIAPLADALNLLPSTEVPYAFQFDNAPIAKVRRNKSVAWFDFGAQITHKDHVHLLARHALANGPFLRTNPAPVAATAPIAARAPGAPTPPQPASGNFGLGLGVALLLGGITYLVGRQK